MGCFENSNLTFLVPMENDFNMKNILVVENDSITLHIIVGMLKDHSNLIHFLPA